MVVQFFRWLVEAVQGNFGVSLIDGRSISADLANRLPVTASLAAGATVLSAVFGIVLGVTAAVRGGGVLDQLIGGFVGLLVALPAFWIGVIFVYLFAVQSSVFPATGYVPFEVSPPQDWALSLALPVITLAVGGAAFIARQTRLRCSKPFSRNTSGRCVPQRPPRGRSCISTPCDMPACQLWPALPPVHRPVRRLGHCRAAICHARSWTSRPDVRQHPRRPCSSRRGGHRHSGGGGRKPGARTRHQIP